jgi:hypothetical protein
MDCQRTICKRCGTVATLVDVRAVERWYETDIGRVRRYAGLFQLLTAYSAAALSNALLLERETWAASSGLLNSATQRFIPPIASFDSLRQFACAKHS